MATFRRGKPVLVAVYVEKPRRNHHHHHHHHLHIHQAKNGNRRAHFLEYSRKLRESARSQASTPLLQPGSHQHSHQKPQLTQMVSIQKKNKRSATPTCLGNWKLLIPRFLRAMLAPNKKKEKKTKKHSNPHGTTMKIKTVIKSFRPRKNAGFASKMFASLRRRH